MLPWTWQLFEPDSVQDPSMPLWTPWATAPWCGPAAVLLTLGFLVSAAQSLSLGSTSSRGPCLGGQRSLVPGGSPGCWLGFSGMALGVPGLWCCLPASLSSSSTAPPPSRLEGPGHLPPSPLGRVHNTAFPKESLLTELSLSLFPWGRIEASKSPYKFLVHVLWGLLQDDVFMLTLPMKS